MPECTCEVEYHWSCDVHVSCDSNCQALRDPQSIDELQAAVTHWQSHDYLSGCSHGC